MGFKLAFLAIRAVEVMFFAGLAGCAVVVILSWISVGRDSFSKKE
jgi:hypothetical protein